MVGPALADDVGITADTTNGIVLDGFAGTTARVLPGVTVSNTAFNFSCPLPPSSSMALAAICASTQAWTLTNEGTIAPADFGDAVHFVAGGSVINAGTIDAGVNGSNGIWIVGGTSGTVDNQLGATIHGTYGAIVIGTSSAPIQGMVTNAGMITSEGQVIGISGNGTVINYATGSIVGHDEQNAVSMILGTSHIVTNSGLIQSNDAGYGTGVAVDYGTVTNNAGAQILGAYNGIWANGSGATSIVNHGTIEASKAQSGGSAIEFDAGGSLTNDGTIRSFTSNSTTGDAGISFTGAGSITNAGTIESTDGGRAILFKGSATHTLNLGTGSVLGGNVQGGSGTDNLVLMGTGAELLGKFLSFETLSMQGTTALTGSATFSSSTTATSGLLSVNGQLTSPTVTIMPGAVLGGGGTITGTVSNGGTIAPGNSIGTLNIAGDLQFNAGSLFQVEIDPMNADEVVVSGTATIDPTAMVSVLATPGTYTDGASYLILNAGTRAGAFGGVIDNSAFLDFALDQSIANQVYLTITTVANFPDVAETPNQFATAGAAQLLGAGNAIYNAVVGLDAASARAAFDLLSGEIHPSLRSLLVDDSRYVRDAVRERVRQAFSDLGPALPDGAAVAMYDAPGGAPITAWGRAYGAFGEFNGDGNAARTDHTSSGIFLGADREAFDVWRFGIAAGYSHSDADVDARNASASIDTAIVTLYGGARFGAVGLRFGGAYAWHGIDTTRAIAFPGFAARATADYGAATAQAFGEAGYEFAVGVARIEPFAQLGIVDVTTDGFTENDGAAALTTREERTNIFLTTLGLHGTGDLVLAGGKRLTADGTLGWRHASGDVTPDTTFTLNGGAGLPFSIGGVPIAQNAALVDVGLGLHLGERTKVRFGYSGEIADDAQSHGLSGDFRVRF